VDGTWDEIKMLANKNTRPEAERYDEINGFKDLPGKHLSREFNLLAKLESTERSTTYSHPRE
jgi:hypothetical protein